MAFYKKQYLILKAINKEFSSPKHYQKHMRFVVLNLRCNFGIHCDRHLRNFSKYRKSFLRAA